MDGLAIASEMTGSSTGAIKICLQDSLLEPF
jgi:hypothetical protein